MYTESNRIKLTVSIKLLTKRTRILKNIKSKKVTIFKNCKAANIICFLVEKSINLNNIVS